MKLFIIFLIIFMFFIPTAIFSQIEVDKNEVKLNNPLTGGPTATTPNQLIGQIINGVLGIVGSLALVMFIYGGFTWMLAAGSNEKVQKGKDILIWATLGLVVIFSAFAIVDFILRGITNTPKPSPTTKMENISIGRIL
ncbi:hypothetical protein KAU09_02070 [Candidatus Parcubacteria bacterium]|nr:hypothetical protein [Candidatus Parcubacteria bacterium]